MHSPILAFICIPPCILPYVEKFTRCAFPFMIKHMPTDVAPSYGLQEAPVRELPFNFMQTPCSLCVTFFCFTRRCHCYSRAIIKWIVRHLFPPNSKLIERAKWARQRYPGERELLPAIKGRIELLVIQ